MININYSVKSVGVGLLFSMSCSVPVLADDTEIYTNLGLGVTGIQPNVLFVMDTSGSMANNSITVQKTYNPAKPYPDTGCRSDRVYWSRGDNGAPGCSSDNYFDSSALQCDHALKEYDASGTVTGQDGPLVKVGFYTDDLSQKRADEWRTIRTTRSSHRSRLIECEEDQGVHGSTSVPTPASFIRNGSTTSHWSSSQNINSWPGRNYTLYSANYLNYLADGSSNRTITRFQAVKEAIESIVSTTNGINIGLMGFNGTPTNDGGQVLYAMEDIATARDPFINFVMDPDFIANAWTPLSETYYEAIHYFGGQRPPWGTHKDANPPSVPSSLDGDGTYKSPISRECQANHIVFLTDGAPTRDTLTTSRLSSLPGYTDMSCADSTSTETNCLDRLAAWAYTNDVAYEASSAHSGEQNITTNTIGFGTGLKESSIALLKRTAAKGGGKYFEANDPNELTNQFTKIVAKVLSKNTTFSSPAISVNAFNRSTHLDNLYFSLFKPLKSAHWPGNLKKYKLDFFVDVNDVDNDKDTTERLPFIADANGKLAIDPLTGYFDSNAESFWSGFQDGENVDQGGAADQFDTFAPRSVYTFTGSYTNTNGVFSSGLSASKLTATANEVSPNNAAITDAMLSITGLPPLITTPSSIPLRETLLDWASGLDVLDLYGIDGTTSDQRLEMGDPLHSQPSLVQYGEYAGGNPILVAYVATNDGYLHAIDADNGKELFSFIPQELLPNLNGLMEDVSTSKTYGLDGDVVAWVNDVNEDGTINGSDHVYLYIGMRRGGNNIYSLDVTDRNNPVLRWVIKGGVGDYAELGQTWSSINVEKIKDGATEKTVLIFGGGYDTNQDGVNVRAADSDGRAVYIVDAESGKLLWSAGPTGTLALPEMQYSIPARIKPLDLSGDGYIDRLYAADMGGQIFRFDINNTNGSALSSSITGGRIANLSGTAIADARRFYYPPDVALIAEKGKAAYLALAITSGYRAHPIDVDIHDRIYLLKDNNVYNAPTTYKALTESDLYDATLNLVAGDGSDVQKAAAKTAFDNSEGWYISLDDEGTGNWIGEKGLSEALMIEGVVIVTTFTPANDLTFGNSCEPKSGLGKVYFLDAFDASPAYPSDMDLRPERYKSLAKGGIPPSPNVIITKGGEPTLCIGTECQSADFDLGIRKTYWYEGEE